MPSQNEARAFIAALNALVPYVPPLLMQSVAGNPLMREIEQAANGEEQRPKPQLVETGGGG